MSFTDKLYFMKQKEKSDGYSTNIVYRKQKWDKFSTDMLYDSLTRPSIGDSHPPMKQYLSTKVNIGVFKRSKHLMVLDCDSFDDMVMATDYLFGREISHVVVESSPGKYWVLTDMVGKFKDLYNCIRVIPGTTMLLLI